MIEANGSAFYAPPTFGQRIRWALGYKQRLPEDFEESPDCPYWAKTIVLVKFDWLDRLRLLLTGAAEITVEHRTSKPVDMRSQSAVTVIGPGDYRLRRPLPADAGAPQP